MGTSGTKTLLLGLAVLPLIGPSGCTAAGPDLTGVWHHAQIDATNLEIRSDGTFRWGIDGCDFLGGDTGVWRTVGVEVELAADAGRTTFAWVDDVSFANQVQWVRLSSPGEGTLTISGSIDGKPFSQQWTRGGVCPTCGGELGPTSKPKLCSDPFLP